MKFFLLKLLIASLLVCLPGCKDRSFVIQSRSMVPTLVPGDVLVVVGSPEEIKRLDLVAFLHEPLGHFYVMRAIAFGGEIVEFRESGLFVNGVEIGSPIPGISYRRLPSLDYRYGNMEPFVVPGDAIFVVCDNFDACQDSRVFGPVKISSIVGIVKKH